MRLEELNVCAEVRAEVASCGERDDERFQPPDGEGDREDGSHGPAGLGKGRGAAGKSPKSLAGTAHEMDSSSGAGGLPGILSRCRRSPRSRWSSPA